MDVASPSKSATFTSSPSAKDRAVLVLGHAGTRRKVPWRMNAALPPQARGSVKKDDIGLHNASANATLPDSRRNTNSSSQMTEMRLI
jgi:hypothetical protein